MGKESEERPNDPISQAGLEDSMLKLMIAQEEVRASKEKTEPRKFAKGGLVRKYDQAGPLNLYQRDPSNPFGLTQEQLAALPQVEPVVPSTSTIDPNRSALSVIAERHSRPAQTTINEFGETVVDPGVTYVNSANDPLNIRRYNTELPRDIVEAVSTKPAGTYNHDTETDKGNNLGMAPTWMRYIPAFASGVMSITDAIGLTNKPDYGEAESILEAARNAGTYTPIRFRPVGNYLTYKPFDRDFYTNKLNAEASAARRAILNTSGGNRA